MTADFQCFELVQDRQDIGQGFTAASFGDADDGLSSKQTGYGLTLDV